jgi:deoxyribodipyrimidine photolyase-related protein
MKTLRLILGDQLSKDISSLKGCSKSEDTILICEVWNESTYVKHHKKKISFLYSAMRHFAKVLNECGYSVSYTKLEDTENSGFLKN